MQISKFSAPSIDKKNNNKNTLKMLTESLFLHVFAANTVFAVTSGVGFLNIQVATELQPNL